jgi:uncharacterized protein DUF4136
MLWLIRAHRAPAAARLAGVLPAAALAIALGGCGSSMTVATDYDRAANFTSYKTYSWRKGTPLPNPLMSQRVVAAIDAQMAKKGFTKVDSAASDVTVTYHAAADKSMDVQTFHSGSAYGCWGGCYGSSMSSTTVTPVTTGTLIVDIVDSKTNNMLWRGSGSDTVSDNPSENEGKVNEAVSRMFENFPPKQKK